MLFTIFVSLFLTSSLLEDVWGRSVAADVKPYIPVGLLNPGNVRLQRSALQLKAFPPLKLPKQKFLEVWTNLQNKNAGPALEVEKTVFKNRRKRSPSYYRNFCQWKLCPLVINSPGGNRVPTIERHHPPAVVIKQS